MTAELCRSGSLSVARLGASTRVELCRLDDAGRRLAALALSAGELADLPELAAVALEALRRPVGACRLEPDAEDRGHLCSR